MFRLWGEKLTDFQVVRVSPFYTWLHFADQPDVMLQPWQPAPVVAPPHVRDGPPLRVLRSHPELWMCPSCEHWPLTTLTVITPSANGAPTPHCRRLMTNLCFVSGQPPDTLVNALVGVIQSPDMAHILFFGYCKKSQWLATFCDNDRNNIPDWVTADHLLLHNHNNSGWNALLVTK